MTLATALNRTSAATVSEIRDRLHYDLMVAKPVLTLDRARGHLAKSDSAKNPSPETAEAIRLLDKAYWTIQHGRDADATTKRQKHGRRR